jgi:heme/copper-type cytochrome/quinol oxidase subunit 2
MPSLRPRYSRRPTIRLSCARLAATTLAATTLAGASLAVLAPATRADEPPTIAVTIKDHRFTPAEIHVPTGKPVVLRITNQDATVEEFDSTALKVEKVIAAGQYGTVRLRPLGPGRYPFMGEYHADTAQGVVVSE